MTLSPQIPLHRFDNNVRRWRQAPTPSPRLQLSRSPSIAPHFRQSLMYSTVATQHGFSLSSLSGGLLVDLRDALPNLLIRLLHPLHRAQDVLFRLICCLVDNAEIATSRDTHAQQQVIAVLASSHQEVVRRSPHARSKLDRPPPNPGQHKSVHRWCHTYGLGAQNEIFDCTHGEEKKTWCGSWLFLGYGILLLAHERNHKNTTSTSIITVVVVDHVDSFGKEAVSRHTNIDADDLQRSRETDDILGKQRLEIRKQSIAKEGEANCVTTNRRCPTLYDSMPPTLESRTTIALERYRSRPHACIIAVRSHRCKSASDPEHGSTSHVAWLVERFRPSRAMSTCTAMSTYTSASMAMEEEERKS